MDWKITINNFQGGFAPAWYKETYPSYGNANQAGAMSNCDITNPGYLTQGSGLAALTAGTEAAAVTTTIKGILDMAVTADATYATGGNKLYKLSSTALTVTSPFDYSNGGHQINHDGSELGEDVALYQGKLYYSYNQAGAIGCIGTYDLATTFDDDWSQQVPTGKADLQSAPHQMCVGLNDRLYIANGRYIADYIGSTTTLGTTALDLPTGTTVQSIKWMNDRLWIGANNSSLTGSNKIKGSIYIWDGSAESWEAEIPVGGRIGALYVKNGVLFVFYQDVSNNYKLGYVNGSNITDVTNFSGGLPDYYQVTEYKDFILWTAGANVYAFGSGDKDLPIRLFQIATAKYTTTVGGLSCPFGTPMIASHNATTGYELDKFSGYTVSSYWKSLMFDVTMDNKLHVINKVIVNFEKLVAGNSFTLSLINNKGTTLYTNEISYTKYGEISTYYTQVVLNSENFRVEIDYTNGSVSANTKIKNVKIYGKSV